MQRPPFSRSQALSGNGSPLSSLWDVSCCPQCYGRDRTSGTRSLPMRSEPQRRDCLRRTLAGEELDALLISNPVNVTYLTGFSGESSYLVLTRERDVLVSDGRFTTQLQEECPDVETYIRPPVQLLSEAAGTVLGKLGAHAVGFESGHLTVAEHEALARACTV